jgi:hypothetical protein
VSEFEGTLADAFEGVEGALEGGFEGTPREGI